MIVLFTSWVKNIIFVVLFASFLELLLPNSSMQRFVRVIMGLFILLAILNPVITMVQQPFSPLEVTTFAGSSSTPLSITKDTKNFTQGRSEVAREVYKKELAQQMQILITALDGVADAKVVIGIEESKDAVQGKINSVVIYITPGTSVTTGTIKKISIHNELKPTEELTAELQGKVIKVITELYQVPQDMVVVKKIHS